MARDFFRDRLQEKHVVYGALSVGRGDVVALKLAFWSVLGILYFE
jgi:hypothetical protein